ncbi:DNA cytosine methyltransferase [Pseudooceanicola onchidii]|uniref:DNA cytosine methyltransferase n=1 Tax=Pseudooceanicola onchidii TaxID=2562279 RepID=UPI0010AADCC1|nr:DNA cytosine methyltransferase [Pseudooceanicola onchidii]
MIDQQLTSLEVCAGAGGQALGLEAAGFRHIALSEIDLHARNTLRLNRPEWNVLEGADADIKTFDGRPYAGRVDLLAGGLPCPPFSVAGKQLGADDERNLFPDFLRLVEEIRPRAILIENVRGFLDASFADFRDTFRRDLAKLGFTLDYRLLNASDFGVPQLRPRVAIIGLPKDTETSFDWPDASDLPARSVGDTLYPLMAAEGWTGAKAWARNAQGIAPTLVGGSKKHGGPDLGPTRARKAWEALGVNGKSLADAPPDKDFVGLPRLTVPMAAAIQGFPPDWVFSGRKTPAYRQVGNAFPPPVAEAIGRALAKVLSRTAAVAA